MSKLVAYLHPRCSTCERARKWLAAQNVAYTEKDISQTAPSLTELRTMLTALGGEKRKLFNTSGMEYRGQALTTKLPAMSDAEALALLASNGMLVKRPFVLGPGVAWVGFQEEKWAETLGRR